LDAGDVSEAEVSIASPARFSLAPCANHGRHHWQNEA
jgi:hypothetical protein